MATTIINPASNTNSSGSNAMGFLIGGIILIVFLALFIIYGIPFIKGISSGTGGVQVNIPKSVDVNVQQAK